MTMQIRLWTAGAMLLAVGVLVNVSGASRATEGEKDPGAITKKVADLVKKGDMAGAKKAAEAGAKNIDDTADLMHLFRPRNKGGLGWGSKAGANPAADGLEKKIQEFAKAVPANIAAQKENNTEAAHAIQAMAEMIGAKAPPKDSGQKTKKAWQGYTDEMREGAAAFAKAAAAGNGAAMQKAASKLNSSCINCHSKFKE